MRAEESGIMVSAVETVKLIGFALLADWQAGMDVPVRGLHKPENGE